MERKVILHIGFHKTGSSALQVFLATNAARLAVAGIGYPYPDPEYNVATGRCSGNAVQVLHRGGFLNAIGGNVGNIESRLTEAYFEALVKVIDDVPQRTTILSSEVLSVASRENLMRFVEMLRPFHDIEIVCFVRDPFDMVLSCWLQMIKDQSQTFHFSSYMEKVIDGANSPSMLNSFALFHNLGLPLTVLNFDHYRNNIAAPFLRAIGAESLIDQVDMTTTREANRSLTPSEAHLVALLHEKLCNRDLTATFLRAVQIRDKLKTPGYYNRDQHQRILDRFAGTISLINQYLPDNQQLATQERNQPDVDFMIMPEDVVVLLELFEKLIAVRTEPRASVEEPKVTGAAVLPSDFDPEAYLFHNPDVAAAGVDPAQHYLVHGRREGRRYRFF